MGVFLFAAVVLCLASSRDVSIIRISRLSAILPIIGVGQLLWWYWLIVISSKSGCISPFCDCLWVRFCFVCSLQSYWRLGSQTRSNDNWQITIPVPVSNPSLSNHLFWVTTFSLTNGWSPTAGFIVIHNAGITINIFCLSQKVRTSGFYNFLY